MEEAEELSKELLERKETVHRKDHPKTLETMNSLSQPYQVQLKYKRGRGLVIGALVGVLVIGQEELEGGVLVGVRIVVFRCMLIRNTVRSMDRSRERDQG